MSYILELHYCCECGAYLGPDNGDGICFSCEDKMIECSKCGDIHMPECQPEIKLPDEPLDHSVDCVCGHPDCPGVYLK